LNSKQLVWVFASPNITRTSRDTILTAQINMDTSETEIQQAEKSAEKIRNGLADEHEAGLYVKTLKAIF